MKLGEIANRLGCELRGDANLEISGVASIEEAQGEQLTFLGNPKYARFLATTRAAAVIVPPEAPPISVPTLVAKNPYLAFAKAIELFYAPPKPAPGIHPTAVVSPAATLGRNCSLGAHVVIGEGVHIGDDAILHPHVVLYPHVRIGDRFLAHSHAVVREHCVLGDRVILQNGAVIGADGFGFAPKGDGSYHKIVQSGIVIVEDDVEIGAHTCVDRATVGATRVGRGTKLDNLVQVGHGSTIGEHTVIAAQAGMAGSTRVGNRVMLGGQVGLAGHLTVGDDVSVMAQAGIGQSIDPGRVVGGTPAIDASVFKRNAVILQNLPELARSVRALTKQVAALEAKLGSPPDEPTDSSR